MEGWLDGVRRTVGRIDDIVLACGPFPRTPLEALERDDLWRSLAIHAIAPLLLVRALAEDLATAQGAVLALTDAGVTRPYTNHVAYLTAKGALQAGLLSARGQHRVLRVARTIADLNGSERVRARDVGGALALRPEAGLADSRAAGAPPQSPSRAQARVRTACAEVGSCRH